MSLSLATPFVEPCLAAFSREMKSVRFVPEAFSCFGGAGTSQAMDSECSEWRMAKVKDGNSFEKVK